MRDISTNCLGNNIVMMI